MPITHLPTYNQVTLPLNFPFQKPPNKISLSVLNANVPVAVGTTAWYADFEEVVAKCTTENQALLYASNFSLGVNLFWQMTDKLSALMENHKEYTASINEIHHTEKLDAPSGTAITTAEKIISNSSNLNDWFLSENGKNARAVSAHFC